MSSIISSTKGINSFAATSKNEERILLIDEVDVFFNKDFYANIYKPYAKLCSDEITALVKEIWEEYKRGVKNVLTVAKSVFRDSSMKNSQPMYLLMQAI